MKEITVEELQHIKHPVVIDIRSPIEFKDGAIPGAINIPLFSDEERHEIGILYKNQGPNSAKWKAMELVSPKIPEMLKTIKDHSENGSELIIQCWRGGMRSKAVATFLEFAGIHAARLAGGYKAYRQFILSKIPEMIPEYAVVLHGLTGVGKTRVLKYMNEMGFPVLDLEEMAAHRGSIFGTIGLENGNNQKIFDSLLYKELMEIQGIPYFLMEAESKRIGKASQPDELMSRKMAGLNIHIHTSLEQRIENLTTEYVLPYVNEPWYFPQISDAVEKVLRWVKKDELKNRLLEALNQKDYQELIRILLVDYYDPKYDYKRQEYEGEFIDIFAEQPKEAAEKIAAELRIRFSNLPEPIEKQL